MTKLTHHCVFCDKSKRKEEIIEGINGDVCKDCLNIIQSLQTKEIKDNDNKNNRNTYTMSKLKNKIDKLVMGQDEAKKQLIVELYKHYGPNNMKANNVFLVGDSGVGKTYLVRSLADIMNVPYLEVDITAYSETGYKGRDITEFLDELIIQQKGVSKNIEKAIIFLDEIDKMTTTTNSGESSTKVQHALLKIIEGMKYSYNIPYGNQILKGTIDTSKIMFIAAGACIGLKEIREERIEPRKQSIGFNFTEMAIKSSFKQSTEYIGDDLIDFGFIPEFVGRFPLVLELYPLTKKNIIDILTIHPNSLLRGAKEIFYQEGIELVITDEDVNWLAEESIKHPLGVRSVSQVLTKRLNNQLYDSVIEGLTSTNLKDALKEKNL